MSGKGKNIMVLLDGRIVYPAASVLILLDPSTNEQQYFKEHVGDISALCVHMERGIVASAEQSKTCRILIWNLEAIDRPSNSDLIEINLQSNIRQVSGLNFSIDCRYLVALGLSDHNMIMIYNIATVELVATARLGHSEVIQMGFNPFLFTANVHSDASNGYSPRSPRVTGKTPTTVHGTDDGVRKTSCYTLLTCGGKQLKFWTLSEIEERVDTGLSHDHLSEESFKGRKLAIPRKKQLWQKKYVLEGTPCSDMDSPDLTCFTLTFDGKVGSFIKSRVFTGTSTGSIHIWVHLEDMSVPNTAFWQPKGSLVTIVTNVHDHPIVDLHYTGPARYDDDEDDEDEEESREVEEIKGTWKERIVSVCQMGVINTWILEGGNRNLSSPITQDLCVSMSAIENLGSPRCVQFNAECNAVVIGTTCNSVCVLSGIGSSDSKQNISLNHLVSGHTGKVRKIAVHPQEEIFATVSTDRTLRLWNSSERRQTACWKVVGNATSLAFSPDGKALAVGNDTGELMVLNASVPVGSENTDHDGSEDICAAGLNIAPSSSSSSVWSIGLRRQVGPKSKAPSAMGRKRSKVRSSGTTGAAVRVIDGNRAKKGVGHSASSIGTGLSSINKYTELTCMAYSPKGDILAVGCRDKLIHILSVSDNYKRLGVCKGHCSSVISIDFSVDGLYMQSNDMMREILLWETVSGKQITQTSLCRDMEWFSWTCVYGWPCQGVHNGSSGEIEDGDINAVARSKDKKLLVCGGSNTIDSSVKLYRFPTLPNSVPLVYGGHTSPVLDVTFAHNDDTVLSIGGNDMCIFQWDVMKR